MLLRAAYVLPVSSDHIEDGAVLVQDGRIRDVGPVSELMERHPKEEVRDYGLAALLPGFVDLHTHLEYSVFGGLVDDLPYSHWKIQVLKKEQALSERDWEDSAVLGATESLKAGITTIADITSSGASFRAAEKAGLRGVFYREVATMRKREVPGVMTSALEDIESWRSIADADRLQVGIAPHATYSCNPELYIRVAQHAVERSLPVATHLAGSRDEYDFVKYGSSALALELPEMPGWDEGLLPTGVSPVKYLQQWGLFKVANCLAIHCVQVDDADVDVLASHDVAVAYCPRCGAKLGMGITPLRSFMARGLRVGIGTDSPASNNTMDFFDEMRIGLLLQRGLTRQVGGFTAEQFIRMATLDGAKALRLDGEIGSLEAGKKADIIAVDLTGSHQTPTSDPYGALVHTANQDMIAMTMVDGKVLYERGELATVDIEEVTSRRDAIRVKLRA